MSYLSYLNPVKDYTAAGQAILGKDDFYKLDPLGLTANPGDATAKAGTNQAYADLSTLRKEDYTRRDQALQNMMQFFQPGQTQLAAMGLPAVDMNKFFQFAPPTSFGPTPGSSLAPPKGGVK